MTAAPPPPANPTFVPHGWLRALNLPFLHHITGQLLLLVLLVALLLSGVIAYLVVSEAMQARQLATEQVSAMARTISENSQAFLERNREQLSYLASRPAMRALDAAHCYPLITELQRMSSLYSVVMLADAQGHVVCQSLAGSEATASYADREWFQSAIGSAGFRTNAPIVGRLTGTLVMPLTLPVRDAQGNTVGVLMFAASLREITRLVARSVSRPERNAQLEAANKELDAFAYSASHDLRCNSYIRKPVDFDEFSRAVRELGLYWLVLNTPPPLPK